MTLRPWPPPRRIWTRIGTVGRCTSQGPGTCDMRGGRGEGGGGGSGTKKCGYQKAARGSLPFSKFHCLLCDVLLWRWRSFGPFGGGHVSHIPSARGTDALVSTEQRWSSTHHRHRGGGGFRDSRVCAPNATQTLEQNLVVSWGSLSLTSRGRRGRGVCPSQSLTCTDVSRRAPSQGGICLARGRGGGHRGGGTQAKPPTCPKPNHLSWEK